MTRKEIAELMRTELVSVSSETMTKFQDIVDEIYDDFKNRTCESCAWAQESDDGYDYYCTMHNEYENRYMSWLFGTIAGGIAVSIMFMSLHTLGEDSYLKPKLIEMQCGEFNSTNGEFVLRNLLKGE